MHRSPTLRTVKRIIGLTASTAMLATTMSLSSLASAATPTTPTPSGTNQTLAAYAQEHGDTRFTGQPGLVFPGNDGKAHTVSFDKYSFKIDGKRIHIWSAEFHYWRLPDINGWRDVLQKIRAAGFNAVSLYFFWGLHQSTENGPFHFDKNTLLDLDKLLTIAQEEGLYVIARPGPYVNAEISMGGLPAYMTNFSGNLRSNDPKVKAASLSWLHAFNEIAKRHLITNGKGSIILYQAENELISEAKGDWLKTVTTFLHHDGITVPLFVNDWGMGGRFRNLAKYGLDVWSYDRYPVGFNCSAPRRAIQDSEDAFRKLDPTTPHFIAEGQGGAFTPWGASYNIDTCYNYTDPAFIRQWGVNNIGNGVTAYNGYMEYGGTNWGYTGSPSSGFTSYDYGAAINEDRKLTPKFSVQKELGYYQEALPQLDATKRVSMQALNPTGPAVNIYQRVATSPQGSVTGHGTRTIAVRLQDSNNTQKATFHLPLVLNRAQQSTTQGFSNDDRDASFAYKGHWTNVADNTAYQGTLKRSSTHGDTATFTFNGTGVKVIIGTGVHNGNFTVAIDGGSAQTITAGHVDSEQNKPSQVVAFTKNGLTAGAHKLVITNTGTTGANIVDLDAVDVQGAAHTTMDSAASGPNAYVLKDGTIGWHSIPQQAGTALTVNGRDALLITADDNIAGNKLYYTTSQLYGKPVTFTSPAKTSVTQYLVGATNAPGETVLGYDSKPQVQAPSQVTVTWDENVHQLRLNYTHTATPFNITITQGNATFTLRIIDRTTAQTTWIVNATDAQGKDRTVAIEGLDILRTVAFKGTNVTVFGSSYKADHVQILVPEGYSTVNYNRGEASAKVTAMGQASFTTHAPQQISPITLKFSKLNDPTYSTANYNDSQWMNAADTTAANPGKKYQGPSEHQHVVLDSNHYGLYEGSVWYRAHFTARSNNPTYILRGNAGSGVPNQGRNPGRLQVWVNGTYVGAFKADGTDQTIHLPNGLVHKADAVVLAVVVHNLGQNLDWSDNGLSKQNRGLSDAVLDNAGAVTWKIHGATTQSAMQSPLNPSGTLYNTGGLHGESLGYQAQTVDEHAFTPTSTLHSTPGITWYRSHFTLNVPENQDTQFHVTVHSSRFANHADHSQLMLYVNGWNTGIYIGDIGPQSTFTIPTAFLNLKGDNTLAVAQATFTDGSGPEAITIDPVYSTTLAGAESTTTDTTTPVTPSPVVPPVAPVTPGQPTTPTPVAPVPANPVKPAPQQPGHNTSKPAAQAAQLASTGSTILLIVIVLIILAVAAILFQFLKGYMNKRK